MSSKVKKNSFLEGTLIVYVAIVITKLLGAVYSIPFYSIIGDEGGVLYSCAYNIYAIFLDVSVSGIPVALSIIISEYNAREMYVSKEKTYRIARIIVLSLSILSFLFLQIFSNQIGVFFLEDMTEGVAQTEIARAVRIISYCLLLAPILSLRRGYLQGHKVFGPPSNSEVFEQLARIIVVLAGSYVTVRILMRSQTDGVMIALTGAAVGALVALLYIENAYRKNRELFQEAAKEDYPDSAKQILKKIIAYCMVIVIVSVSNNVYSLVDMKMLLVGLHRLNFSDTDTQVIASITSTWIPKICMIVTALSIGLSRSIAPHAAENFTLGDYSGVNQKVNLSIKAILVGSLPLAVGITMFADPVYQLFYGSSEYGGTILAVAVYVYVIASVAAVIATCIQSIGKGKIVCISTLCGISINLGMDLPLIYLFHNLGLPPYLGACFSSILGQSINIAIMLIFLRRETRCGYTGTLKMAVKLLVPLAVMFVGVFGLKLVWPIVEKRGILLLLQLGAFALLGAILFFAIAFKMKIIDEIAGENAQRRILDKILRKIHIRK